MSTDKDRRADELKESLVEPISRDDFLAEWREDPEKVIAAASKADLSFEGYANVRSPATEESAGSAVEYLMYNEGVRYQDDINGPTTRLDDLPNLDPPDGNPEPLARMVNGFLDECYFHTLLTGERAIADLSNLTVQAGWRPYVDSPKYRLPQIAPGFNFMSLVGFSQGIRDDRYRLRQWKNATGEQVMQAVAESVEPKLFELTRATQDITFTNWRAGIEWTDDFATATESRLSDITNAVQEIALGHRIGELQRACKTITDGVTHTAYNATGTGGKTVAGVASEANLLKYPQWTDFVKTFGNAYRPDTAIGNATAITTLELMSMSGADQNITFGTWALIPNSNINSLNGQMSRLDYGWVEGDSATGFNDTSLFVFQRATTLAYIFRLGMNQDAMERSEGQRKTRRYLGAQSGFGLMDPTGLRRINFGT